MIMASCLAWEERCNCDGWQLLPSLKLSFCREGAFDICCGSFHLGEVRKGNDMKGHKISEWKGNSNCVIKTVSSGQRLESMWMVSLWAWSLNKKGGTVAQWSKGNGHYVLGQHYGRNMDEWNTYKSILLHIQVMEEHVYGNVWARQEAEQFRQISTVLLLGGSTPINCTMYSNSSRQHSVILTLCSAWFFY